MLLHTSHSCISCGKESNPLQRTYESQWLILTLIRWSISDRVYCSNWATKVLKEIHRNNWLNNCVIIKKLTKCINNHGKWNIKITKIKIKNSIIRYKNYEFLIFILLFLILQTNTFNLFNTESNKKYLYLEF